MKVYEAMARALADLGATTLFGLMGDGNLYLVQSFVHDQGGAFVAAANEGGATLMALGYATVSGRPGLVSVTHGPGLTNCVSALFEGVKGRIPLILLCADTAAEDRDYAQNIPQRETIVATGAGFEQVRSPRTAVEDLLTAWRRAQAERRPIALNIPRDFQWEEFDYQPVSFRRSDHRTVVPEGPDVDDGVGIIASARRPVILAGRGAIGPDDRAAMLRLADRIGAPVSTTLNARDLFKGEPHNLGIFGSLSTAIAADCILESDTVIAFGASLNRQTTSHGAFLRGKRVVQVSLDPADIGRYVSPDVGIVGDMARTADLVVNWLDQAEIPSTHFASSDLARNLAAYDPLSEFDDVPHSGGVNLAQALIAIDSAISAERVVVTDAGRYLFQPWKLIGVHHPRFFLNTLYSGSIGFGVSEAIGAGAAAPGLPVLAIVGDGGFMLGGLAEFNTAVRHGTDLIVVVCNDRAYGAEHIELRRRDMDPVLTTFDWPSFAEVGRSLGGDGITLASDADVPAVVAAIRNRKRPLIVDILLDPDAMPHFR